MKKPILEVIAIGKKYRIRHLTGGYLSLRERIVDVLHFEKNITEDFWALEDVSFHVEQGESLGIIGRNGAGKSTLLKILSKITLPTKGRIISRGRIASLLEVGTGFHPELSGRENVFFNGSLLGMKHNEIVARFEEIVDFSGTEKFLDTPLKHYSSGMQLRLAFSVAAFLEPEILVVDEVLAVGDAEFQKKCLSKMEDVSRSGRTVLFVSHNMEAVRSLCPKCIVLNHGRLQYKGSTAEAIQLYLETLTREQRTLFRPDKPLEGKGFFLLECSVKAGLSAVSSIKNGDQMHVQFKLLKLESCTFSLYLFVFRDESLAFISSDLHQPTADQVHGAQFEVTFTIPPYLLNPGYCRLGLMIADYNGNTEQFFNEMDLLSFTVEDDGLRRGNRYTLGWSGAVSPLLAIHAQSFDLI